VVPGEGLWILMLSFCEVACRFAQYIFSSDLNKVSSKEDSLTNGDAHPKKFLKCSFFGKICTAFNCGELHRFYILKAGELIVSKT
jgi:hypothetical protein